MWPGRAQVLRPSCVGSIAASTVRARSRAEMPVVTSVPAPRSGTQNAVPKRALFSLVRTISGMRELVEPLARHRQADEAARRAGP